MPRIWRNNISHGEKSGTQIGVLERGAGFLGLEASTEGDRHKSNSGIQTNRQPVHLLDLRIGDQIRVLELRGPSIELNLAG